MPYVSRTFWNRAAGVSLRSVFAHLNVMRIYADSSNVFLLTDSLDAYLRVPSRGGNGSPDRVLLPVRNERTWHHHKCMRLINVCPNLPNTFDLRRYTLMSMLPPPGLTSPHVCSSRRVPALFSSGTTMHFNGRARRPSRTRVSLRWWSFPRGPSLRLPRAGRFTLGMKAFWIGYRGRSRRLK